MAQRVVRGIACCSMTAALEGGEWAAARPGRTLPPGKTRYPFYKRPSVPNGRSRRAEYLIPTGIPSRTVQPVVSRYLCVYKYMYMCVCVCVCSIPKAVSDTLQQELPDLPRVSLS